MPLPASLPQTAEQAFTLLMEKRAHTQPMEKKAIGEQIKEWLGKGKDFVTSQLSEPNPIKPDEQQWSPLAKILATTGAGAAGGGLLGGLHGTKKKRVLNEALEGALLGGAGGAAAGTIWQLAPGIPTSPGEKSDQDAAATKAMTEALDYNKQPWYMRAATNINPKNWSAEGALDHLTSLRAGQGAIGGGLGGLGYHLLGKSKANSLLNPSLWESMSERLMKDKSFFPALAGKDSMRQQAAEAINKLKNLEGSAGAAERLAHIGKPKGWLFGGTPATKHIEVGPAGARIPLDPRDLRAGLAPGRSQLGKGFAGSTKSKLWGLTKAPLIGGALGGIVNAILHLGDKRNPIADTMEAANTPEAILQRNHGPKMESVDPDWLRSLVPGRESEYSPYLK